MPIKKSYKNVGKRERQEDLFPELEKESGNKGRVVPRGTVADASLALDHRVQERDAGSGEG